MPSMIRWESVTNMRVRPNAVEATEQVFVWLCRAGHFVVFMHTSRLPPNTLWGNVSAGAMVTSNTRISVA